MMDQKVIEGIVCYHPDLAYTNDGFHSESFESLYHLEEKNFWFKSRNRIIKFFINKYLKREETKEFLEIGCGTGYVLKGLTKNKNLRLNGSEIHLEGLKYAKKRLPNTNFFQLDATNIPFRDQFDGIGAFDVLEHIEEDSRVMKNIKKALKPGGYFFISVPQYPWMWSFLDDMACHKRRYTRKELKEKLIAEGFEITYISSWVFALFPFMVLSRYLKKNKKTSSSEDQTSELKLNPVLNFIFIQILKIDEALIKIGFSLPFGGSLFAIAKKR